ncbi:MAG: sensor of ECF-type sigma factor [Aquaticitalea sp.]
MRTLLFILLFSVSLSGFSQDDDRRERIKALKVAYLTEQLDLSKSEAEKFWPIYNAYENEEAMQRRLGKEKRKAISNNITESEAKSVLNDLIAYETERQKLKVDFIESLIKILPAKKIIKMKIAEDEFNKKMFEEYKKRKGQHKD